MTLILKTDRAEIWEMPAHVAPGYPPCSEFYVYGAMDSGDPVVCPSEGYAREVAAGL